MKCRVMVLVTSVVASMLASLVVVAGWTGTSSALVGTSRFVALSPDRLLDTRGGAKPGNGAVVRLDVRGRGGVATTATAVVLNVTATESTTTGFVTVYPSGEGVPNASNVNLPSANFTIANLVTVRIGADGAVNLYTQTSTHLVADVFGYYEPAALATAGRFVPVNPIRAVDTREVGGALGARGTRRVPLPSVPADAQAAVLNVTAVDAAGGFWTVFAAGSPQPGTSNLNITTPRQNVPNQVIVPVANGAIDVFSQNGGHLVVDVAGYFTGESSVLSSDGLFVPLSPSRVLDTRTTNNPLGSYIKPGPGWTVELPMLGRAGVPANAAAVVVNTTVTASRLAGFVAVFPGGTPWPGVSNLNANYKGHTVANHVVTPVSDVGISIFTQTGTHLVVDVSGFYTGQARSATVVAVNPSWSPAFPGRIYIPRIGLNDVVGEGIDDATVNAGPAHWPGTSGTGALGNMAIFGHRTSYSAPFRNIDRLSIGDPIYIQGEDIMFRYEVISTSIDSPSDLNRLNPASVNDRTLTLIACHPPGSVQYRIVVTARVVSAVPT